MNVLSSLLKQLLRRFGQSPWPKDLFQTLRAKSSDPCNTLDPRDVISFIFQCAEEFSKVFFIFDALDECEDLNARWKVLSFINTAAQMEPRVRVLLTSRPHLPANDGLSSADIVSVYAHPDDIEAYIRATIEYKRYKPTLQEEIVRTLLSKADGLYYILKNC